MHVSSRSIVEFSAKHRWGLAAAAVVSLALIVIGGVSLAVAGESKSRDTTRQSKRLSANPQSPGSQFGEMNLGIPFGATAAQVLQRLGPPNGRRGGCWSYSGRTGTVRGRYSGPYVDAVKYCFAAGPTGDNVVVHMVSHYATYTLRRRDPTTGLVTTTRYAAHWGQPLTILRPPAWYLQEDS